MNLYELKYAEEDEKNRTKPIFENDLDRFSVVF